MSYYPPDLTEDEVANIEHHWVKLQLEWCDHQIRLHNSQDKRAEGTLEKVYSYSVKLRDYTTVSDKQAKVITEKPEL